MKTYTLSNAQLNILDTEMFYGNTAVNVLSGVCLFTDGFAVEDISDAINTLLRNNEGLRTRLLKYDNGAVRYVHTVQRIHRPLAVCFCVYGNVDSEFDTNAPCLHPNCTLNAPRVESWVHLSHFRSLSRVHLELLGAPFRES